MICYTNVDFNGEWNKADVEAEMKELECFDLDNPSEWIDYILTHMLGEYDLSDGVYDAILNEDVIEIAFKLSSNDVVRVKKIV